MVARESSKRFGAGRADMHAIVHVQPTGANSKVSKSTKNNGAQSNGHLAAVETVPGASYVESCSVPYAFKVAV